MDNNKIGNFIANLRKKKNLTQQELGDKLHITDKAVSKWERGLSLPDITILEKLADVLDTDIYSILQIEKKENIDIDKLLQEEKNKIKKIIIKKIMFIMIPIIIIICIILFKLLPFGYDVSHVRYTHNENKLINLGVPKFSFYMKNNEDSYSYKSLRGKSVLKSEVKGYLNTLEHISCNNTTYYYDNDTDITIVDYSVKGNIIYNTISYSIKNRNYCDAIEINEYKEKLGYLNRIYTIYSEKSNLSIFFSPKLERKEENNWIANLEIYYQGEKENKVIEVSSGTFEIKNDELIYYRTNIEEKDNNIEIPNVSSFVIKNRKLILKENYLEDYEKSIVLQ